MSTPVLSGGVVVVSDRCSAGLETDRSGPVLASGLVEADFEVLPTLIVPDSIQEIRAAVKRHLENGARVILLTGGTGLSPQDITPEAAAHFIETPLPGLTQLLIGASLKETSYAALSRGSAGLTGGEPRSLIVTLAGSVNAARTTIETLSPLLAHLFSQVDRANAPKGSYVEH